MDNDVNKREVGMNNVGDIMKGAISAILISVGYVVLWCAAVCLIMSATGMEGTFADIVWCGVGCLVASVIMMGSGIAWYQIVKPKA